LVTLFLELYICTVWPCTLSVLYALAPIFYRFFKKLFSLCVPRISRWQKSLWNDWKLDDWMMVRRGWLADPHDSRFKPHRLGNVPFFGQTLRRTFQFIAIFIAENFVRRFLCVVKWQRAKELGFVGVVNNALCTVRADKKIINLANGKNISQLSYPVREWKLLPPPHEPLSANVCSTLTVLSNS